jgi:hypothetical protein
MPLCALVKMSWQLLVARLWLLQEVQRLVLQTG